MNKAKNIVCFGEVLWDVFPNAKVIGGAPLNVALRLHSQGNEVGMISRLGRDEDGKKAFEYIKEMGLSTKGIQWDELLPTGEVLISINKEGSASYVISKPVAWDAIALSAVEKSMVELSSILVFGSLACRSSKSKATLEALIECSNFTVFDVNLRSPHYTYDLLIQMMKRSDFVKMNDEELIEITNSLNTEMGDLKSRSEWLMEVMDLEGLCVTRGATGALLYHQGRVYDHPGYSVQVRDTVGAGDSFLATLITELFVKGKDPITSLDKACGIGALVASKAGANCEVSETELDALVSNE